jgi:hypothetical protein
MLEGFAYSPHEGIISVLGIFCLNQITEADTRYAAWPFAAIRGSRDSVRHISKIVITGFVTRRS